MSYKEYHYKEKELKSKTDHGEIIKQIEKSRRDLHLLIDMTNDFTDESVIIQSQKLDRLLNTYEQLKYNDTI